MRFILVSGCLLNVCLFGQLYILEHIIFYIAEETKFQLENISDSTSKQKFFDHIKVVEGTRLSGFDKFVFDVRFDAIKGSSEPLTIENKEKLLSVKKQKIEQVINRIIVNNFAHPKNSILFSQSDSPRIDRSLNDNKILCLTSFIPHNYFELNSVSVFIESFFQLANISEIKYSQLLHFTIRPPPVNIILKV